MVDPQTAVRFSPFLRPGERMVWTGRPRGGIRLSGRDAFLIPFSLLWGGFAIFWEVSVIGIGWRTGGGLGGTPVAMALFGAVFVALGLFMIFGRFLVDAWIRGRTIYALTDRRALVLRRVHSEKLLSADLANPSVERRGDGRGNIRFGRRPELASLFNTSQSWGMWIPALSDHVEFVAIDDVMTVYQRVGNALR